MVAEGTAAGLADVLREAFGWEGAVTVAPGPRGATARIWKVTLDEARYALKEGHGDPPSPETIAAEVAFVDQAASAGVRVPRLHPDRAGRWLVPGPDGSWLRVYDWLDVLPVDLTAPSTPSAVGDLLARLHRHSSPTTTEPGGSAPDPWYERPPAVEELVAAAMPDAPWSARLTDRSAEVPDLLELVTPADPHRLVRCHRDLHPGNVLADGSGSLVVIDQDDLGPADPARELARALFDWWSDPGPDLAAMAATYAAYRVAGGPARVRKPADFTMLVATRLNFLLRQLRIASDAAADPSDRAWAEQEIDESLRIMPTIAHIGSVIDVLSS